MTCATKNFPKPKNKKDMGLLQMDPIGDDAKEEQ
jgi:hypothetical protein